VSKVARLLTIVPAQLAHATQADPVLLSLQTVIAALRAIPGVDMGLCPRSVYDDLARGIALRRCLFGCSAEYSNLQFDRFDLALTV